MTIQPRSRNLELPVDGLVPFNQGLDDVLHVGSIFFEPTLDGFDTPFQATGLKQLVNRWTTKTIKETYLLLLPVQHHP